MAFWNCNRKMARFLALSIYLWIYVGLWTQVVAKTNDSEIRMTFQKKQSTLPFRVLPTTQSADQSTSYAHKPTGTTSATLNRTLLRHRKSDASPETRMYSKLLNSVRRNLQYLLNHQVNTIYVTEKRSIQLNCSTPFVNWIRYRYPDTQFLWSHNSRWLRPDGVKYAIVNGNLLINNSNANVDQGVYVCHLFSKGRWRVTLSIFALAVASKTTVYRVYAGTNLRVFCDSQTLGQLYKGSTRSWLIKNSAVKGLTHIDARLDRADTLINVQQNQSGVWTCSVTKADSPDKYWQTNQILVKVCPAPSWWRSLMYQFPIPTITELVVFIIFIISLFLCASATRKRYKQEERAGMRI